MSFNSEKVTAALVGAVFGFAGGLAAPALISLLKVTNQQTGPSTVEVLETSAPLQPDAPSVEKGMQVTVHFEIHLAEPSPTGVTRGKRVDSSRSSGQPFTFLLGSGQVFPGWDQAIRYMKVGERRASLIPAALAYGKEGIKGKIPPDANIILDVEVLRIE